MFKINDIKLEKVIGLNSDIPMNTQKEFVLVGRSNVGKSSFINTISNRKNYAHTSSTPGKTRTINYYLCNNSFYLVDLPGYGYAKASTKEINDWAKFINKYLTTSPRIEEIILIIDARIKPTEKDKQMYDFILRSTGFEPIIVATKTDKLKKSELENNIKTIKSEFNLCDNSCLINFSSLNKSGSDEFLKLLSNLI